MAQKKIKPHEKISIISKTIAERKQSAIKELESNDYFKISFFHLDKEQGDSFHSWEEQKRLADAMLVLQNYCASDLLSQTKTKKFTIYNKFPPKEKTAFGHPKQVPLDAIWGRIHVTGKQCIIGHVVRSTFYIVFLDGEHQFWQSEI